MRKLLLITACTALIASCTNDTELNGGNNSESEQNTIGFEVLHRNSITTKDGKSNLQEAGHYNFGVFAYKNISSSSSQQVMNNYLVGYMDADDKKGYSFSADVQTTLNDSKWAYEKLGSSEYTYDGTDGYYTKDNTFYMSNNANQYLKYWDKSSESVDFYAYAPYINGDNTKTASYDHNSKTLTIPSLGIQDGYDDKSMYEYMYANTNVPLSSYNNEVALSFKRISAKIKIAFYEVIDGYKVEILDLVPNTTDNTFKGVCAAPSIKSETDNTYSYGTLYHNAGATINFANSSPSLNITGNNDRKFQRNTTDTDKKQDHIKFTSPSGNISENKFSPTPSSTEYYLIPANTDNTGLTFHVSYKLTADDTNETIIVRNATVFVPFQKDENTKFCDWKSNYTYTYVFNITKKSTGTTGSDDNIDPSDPTPNTEDALYPIIFDECTIENWTEVDSEHNINDNN